MHLGCLLLRNTIWIIWMVWSSSNTWVMCVQKMIWNYETSQWGLNHLKGTLTCCTKVWNSGSLLDSFFFLLGFISVFCGTQVQVICGGWRAVNILSLYNENRLLVTSVWKLYWSQILAFSVNFLVFYYVKSWYLKISPPGALLHLAVSALQQ